MLRTTRRSLFRITLAVLCSVSITPVFAEYPTRTIRIVVPSAAGTPPDILSRIVANEVSKAEGWRVITDNKPGAMQTLGAGEVLRQDADGHTVLAIAMSSTVAPALLPNVTFQIAKDFAPVLKLGSANHVLVVNPSVPARSLSELVALLKSEPDRLTFSSGGFGTPAHLAGELFKLSAGVRATHVPYQALPHAIGDLLNGTNQFQFITPLPVLDLVATGKLRALAVTGRTRMAALPDIPTVVEEGQPDLVIQDWIGFVVKTGTSKDTIDRLNSVVNAALATAEVRQAFTKIAADPGGGSPDEFGAYLGAQLAHWAKLVKDTGLRKHP